MSALTADNEAYVGSSWSLDEQDPEYLARMVRGTMGFELAIQSIEGKFKMSQNRSEADRESVCAALEARPAADTNSHETAAWIRRVNANRRSGSR
jgi:transcriptional regulator